MGLRLAVGIEPVKSQQVHYVGGGGCNPQYVVGWILRLLYVCF